MLVDGDGGAEAVDALGAAAANAGLTVLRVGRTDPIALERSVIGFLVNRRAELDRRAADLEGQLARLALLGRGLDVLAAAIGAFLGRAVVIEGRRGDPIAVHAPGELAGAGAAVSRYLASPTAAALRVSIPAPADEPGAGGRLVLLGDDPPNELERIAADRIAALLALELARDAAVRQAREETRRGDPLPADGPPWVVVLARQAAADRPDDIAAREETRAELRLLVSPRRLALRGTSESLELRLVAAAPADDPEGLAIGARIAGFLGRVVADLAPVPRAGRAAGGRGLRASDARGRRGARRTATGRPRSAPARLPPARQRPQPAGRPAPGPRTARAGARRPRSVQEERLRTLAAILETGSLGEAAARLGVHRNTVAYRVQRLEALGGWDLSDPDLRFASRSRRGSFARAADAARARGVRMIRSGARHADSDSCSAATSTAPDAVSPRSNPWLEWLPAP